ncbi:NACHT domain-containing protein [Streptomyces sp. NPDC001262]|uniref:NACHT domain-containing protein n=1 Tax=Streptomyces sp. NPDC001262 TaxID=3364552 RepID=UPI0036CC88C3
MTSEFSTLLRRFRRRAGMTQEALAERANVGVRTIRGLETGERADPRVTTVRLLADALGLEPEEREELLAAVVRQGGEVESPIPPEIPPEAPPVEPAPAPPGSALDESLADVADQLAQAVAARWQREEEQRQVHDPYPLPVRWQAVPEELTDHWANIRRLPAGSAHSPLDLSGRLDEIVAVYRRIPSGRLVLLGRSGSGKTVLTVRFVLDCLKSRTHADAVPVIFSIGSWDPTVITFRAWLTAQLTRDYPGLAAPAPGGSTLAAVLVETGRVLPVLDGFDEIAGGLRRPALESLNATTLPLVLTSRPSEYAAAVAETDVLTAAAAVELTDLTLDHLADYLPRTTRKARGGDPTATAWDPVLTELRERPEDRAGANLAAVLTTPLMVTLARAVYSDTPGQDPAALLDTGRFGSPEELEDHLLDNFTTTAYRPRPGDRRHEFDPERARYWLGYLADHLTRLDTPNLEWWRLGCAARRSTRTLATAVVICVVIGLTDCLVGLLTDTVVGQIVDGLMAGPFAGLVFGVTYWFMVAAKGTAVAPTSVRLRLFGRAGRPLRRTVHRLLIGVLFGLAFGSGFGALHGLSHLFQGAALTTCLRAALGDGLFYGTVFALGAGPAFGILALLETPRDIRSAVNPVSLLQENSRTVLTQLTVWAPAFGLLVGSCSGVVIHNMPAFMGPYNWNLSGAFKLGTASALGGGLGYALGLTAWGQWVVFSRIWLPLTGRLPWSVMAFLEDAYERGVLRQAGAVYQFRHARLQGYLARGYGRHAARREKSVGGRGN